MDTDTRVKLAEVDLDQMERAITAGFAELRRDMTAETKDLRKLFSRLIWAVVTLSFTLTGSMVTWALTVGAGS